jgi:hypothetical protein
MSVEVYPFNGVSLSLVLRKMQRIAWNIPVKPPNKRPVRQASSLTIRSFSDNSSCNNNNNNISEIAKKLSTVNTLKV